MFKRITQLAGPIVLAAGLIVGGTAIAAHASVGSGNQYDQFGAGEYGDAWNGGPLIKDYRSQGANNDFTLFSWSDLSAGFRLSNGNPNDAYDGECIGDNNNDQNDAKAGLWDCSLGAPWGARFTLSNCTYDGLAGYYVYDIHWGGYLSWGTGNGSQAFLNNQTPTCLVVEDAY